MKQREIIRDGKLYTLIGVLAKEERTKYETVYRCIERGMPTVTLEGHVYINRDDYRDFRGIQEPPEKPTRRNTLVIGGRTHHPPGWYVAQHPVTRGELWDLPFVMVRGTRYVAEDDFMQKYWWMEG